MNLIVPFAIDVSGVVVDEEVGVLQHTVDHY